MGFQQGFRINTNTASLDTYRAYSKSQAGLEQNIERLSSGLRINSAKDDAAGLAISERMNNQVRGMQQANRNVQQGVNLLQTAEGAMNEISNILGRMRELAVQSASDTMNSDDRASIDLEFEQLKSEITRIADSTEYNDTKLLQGSGKSMISASGNTVTNGAVSLTEGESEGGTYSFAVDTNNVTLTTEGGRSQTVIGTGYTENSVLNFDELGVTITGQPTATLADDVNGKEFVVDAGVTVQVGADNNNNNQIGFGIRSHKAVDLGLSSADLGDDIGNAQTAITTLDAAIKEVNDARSNVGSLQNRLEFTSSNLMNSIQNNSASMSTIRDADFAAEAAELAKNQILTQSGTAMLAQANSLSQNVLSLIR